MVNRIVGRKVLPERLRLVPKRPIMVVEKKKGKPVVTATGAVKRVSYFATGGPWESLVNRFLTFTSWVMFLYIVYLSLPWSINIDFGTLVP